MANVTIPHLFTEMGPLKDLYAPLVITWVQETPQTVDTNIFLTSYSEKYNGRWASEETFGTLNKKWSYAGTGKTIDMQFTLPAKNVQEAVLNLQYTTLLAKTVHGNYDVISVASSEMADLKRFRLLGGKLFKIKFGSLIRDELVYISNFNMNINFEAGFYEQDAVGAELKALADTYPLEYVYHDKVGEILPKQIDVTLSFIMVHDKPLGFGGAKRVEGSLGWAPNDGRDWPHGTGPISAAEYCQSEPSAEFPPHGGPDEWGITQAQAEEENAARLAEDTAEADRIRREADEANVNQTSEEGEAPASGYDCEGWEELPAGCNTVAESTE